MKEFRLRSNAFITIVLITLKQRGIIEIDWLTIFIPLMIEFALSCLFDIVKKFKITRRGR